MKKLPSVLMLIVSVSTALIACSSVGPRGVVEDYFKGWEQQDAEKVNETLCENSPMRVDKNDLASIDEIKVEDAQYKEKNATEDSVTVVVKGTLKLDDTEREFETEFLLVTVIKGGSDWCIRDSQSVQ